MLIYEKWLEENSEKVRHLFGTEANIPSSEDEQLAYQNAQGSTVSDLTFDETYLDDGHGGIIRASNGMKIAVGIVDPDTSEVTIVIPEGGYEKSLYVAAGYYKYFDSGRTWLAIQGNSGEISVTPGEDYGDDLSIEFDYEEEGISYYTVEFSGDAIPEGGVKINVSDSKDTISLTFIDYSPALNMFSADSSYMCMPQSNGIDLFCPDYPVAEIGCNKGVFPKYIIDDGAEGEYCECEETAAGYKFTAKDPMGVSVIVGKYIPSSTVPGEYEQIDQTGSFNTPGFINLNDMSILPSFGVMINGQEVNEGDSISLEGIAEYEVDIIGENPTIVKNSGSDTITVSGITTGTYFGLPTIPHCFITVSDSASINDEAEFTVTVGTDSLTFSVKYSGLG